jgi:DNA-binding transcriptional LysR family regulator
MRNLHHLSLISTAVEYFRVAARTQSIRRAAEELHVSPSALSRQIAQLEDQLETPLFERLPRGLRLTSAGEILLYHVRQSIGELQRASDLIGNLRGVKGGHVRVSVIESVARDPILATTFKSFWDAYPAATGEIAVVGSERVLADVESGLADFGIAFDVPASKELTRMRDAQLRVGAIMSPRHVLSESKTLRVEEVLKYRTFLPDDSLALKLFIGEYALRHADKMLPAVTTSSISVMVRLITSAMGVGFKTRVGLDDEIRHGEIVYVPLSDPGLRAQQLVLFIRRGARLHPAAEALANLFSQSIAALSEP